MAKIAPPVPESDYSRAVKGRPLALAKWLYVVALMVIIIVMVGGITRLTESGLSITHWSLVTGILPPLTDQAWQAEFDLYRQTGEYRFESGPAGMDLAAFKFIYFWEWFHRILGRLIGLAFLLPMVWFWIRRAIPAGYKGRLLALFALICGQGALGWYMVASGVGTASDAAVGMELGCDGILMNTAIAEAKDPIRMARAMRLSVEAGREAYLAGRMGRRMYADPSSPLAGLI